jgi:hypothetical protein
MNQLAKAPLAESVAMEIQASAAVGSRRGLDDLTFHGRGVLNQVERCGRLADRLGGSAANDGAANARIATVAKSIFFMVSPSVVRSVLNTS